MIEIKNLSYDYGDLNKVLKNINLKINDGDFLVIVGENGSGKSTLLKCILGLNKIEKNKIKVEDKIGYLPQSTEIQNNFPATIEEIVLSGTVSNSTHKIFYTKQNKEKANEIMKKLNIYEIRKKCFYELSGGQRQRTLLARALCATENTIILDEPVNGLDVKIVNDFYKFLYKLNKEENLTIVMVTHDIDRCLNYCSRVVEIENGKIVKDVPSKHYLGGAGVND